MTPESERPLEPIDDEPAETDEPEFHPVEECADLLGQCLWDIFSDNHEVLTADGRPISLGSFRSAGAFIGAFWQSPDTDAENRSSREWDMDYVRFSLGTIWTAERVDLAPVYA